MTSLLGVYLDTKKTDSDRDGIREYGGKMRREMEQEEMMKTTVRVCKCPSSKGFPQFRLGSLTL